jgi:hypothetical protein
MSDIICLKLISGEELAGQKVEMTSNGDFVIRNVASIVMMPGQGNQVSLGLMPFLPYAESKQFTIAREAVVTSFSPNVDMLNNYNRMYGSGIQIAKTV